MGPSGSGKSTLLNLVERARQPDLGPHRHRRRGHLQARRRRADPVPAAQDRPDVPVLQPDAHARRARERAPAGDARAQGRCRTRARRSSCWPRSASPRVASTGCIELSGGEMQRVAIARALVLEPQADPGRRADRQPRQRHGRAGARPAQAQLRERGHHARHGHARPPRRERRRSDRPAQTAASSTTSGCQSSRPRARRMMRAIGSRLGGLPVLSTWCCSSSRPECSRRSASGASCAA